MPLAPAPELPSAILSPDIETIAPEAIVKIVPTALELLPETVKLAAPGAVMVMSAVIAGSAESRVIVPVAVMLIMLPGALFAFVIAARSEPVPLSFVLPTVNVAPEALPRRPRPHNTRQRTVDNSRLHEGTRSRRAMCDLRKYLKLRKRCRSGDMFQLLIETFGDISNSSPDAISQRRTFG
jgi:hypothetical protein